MTLTGPARVILGLALTSALAACGGDAGQDAASSAAARPGDDYPTKTIRFLVPFAAGGPTDLTSRTVGACLEQGLGETVLVENKPGGSGALGMTELTGAEPDGHTLGLVTAGTLVVTPLANKVGYTKDDITPIGVMAQVPSLLAVGKGSPHKDAGAFFAAAKAQPNALKVGVPGASTPQAIELKRLATDYGVTVTVVPFNGNAEMTTALLGGNVDAVLINASADVVKNIDAGAFIPLAVSPKERLPWLPDTPTLVESGFAGVTLSGSTFGLAGPAGLPQPVSGKLEGALGSCLSKPDVQEKLGKRYVPGQFLNGAALTSILDEAQRVYEPILAKNTGR